MAFKTGLIGLILWLQLVSYAEGQLAAMSIDLGDEFLKFGLVKPGVPMETVINKESRRKTPNIVAIRKGERHFGDSALQISVKFPANAITNFIDLLGKPFDHPSVEAYKQKYPYHKLSAHPDRNTVVFEIEEVSYPVETVLAMALWNAQEQTSAHAFQQVKNVVISIPSYFNHSERVAVVNATQVANLNLLSLLYDGSAAALNYGVFRRKELTEKPQNLLIFDVGSHKTVATLVEYQLIEEKEGAKEKTPIVKTIGIGFDRDLGGQDVTRHIRAYLVQEFKAKHKTKTDIEQNPRAMAKLWKEADRVKQVLSANTDHSAQIEGLFEDIDFKTKVNRDLVDEHIETIKERLLKTVETAVAQAGIEVSGVEQVVLMGAGTRIPKIQKILVDYLEGKELARFLNTDEAIVLGAVYEAAAKSKGFRVTKFIVEEKPVYPTTEEEAAFTGLTATQITETKRVLAEFEKSEKLKVEKESALNSLESLVYDISARLDDDAYSKYITKEESDAIRAKADEIRTWLEDEVTPETEVKTLKDKRAELLGQAKKINYRKRQHEERPKALKSFEEAFDKASVLIPLFKNDTGAESESAFTEEDLKKYEDSINESNTWFVERKVKQETLTLNEEPVFTVKEITEKVKTINNEVNLMKSKLYLHKMKIVEELKKAEEKARKEKEAAEKAAQQNSTIPETPEGANATETAEEAPATEGEGSTETTVAPEATEEIVTPATEGTETTTEASEAEKEEL